MKRLGFVLLMMAFICPLSMASETADIQVDRLVLIDMLGESQVPHVTQEDIDNLRKDYPQLKTQVLHRLYYFQHRFGDASKSELIQAARNAHLRKTIHRLVKKYPNVLSKKAIKQAKRERKKQLKEEKKAMRKKMKEEKRKAKMKAKAEKKKK